MVDKIDRAMNDMPLYTTQFLETDIFNTHLGFHMSPLDLLVDGLGQKYACLGKGRSI
jgi:hypothetical protein